MTGGRLNRLRDHLSNERFFLTYGDGLSNININDFMVRFDGSYDLESHWRFNFNELSFRGHDFEFASLGGFFESKYDSSQNVRYLFFESLDIENLSKFTEHSNLSQARFVKDLLDLNPRGKLDKFLYEEGQLDTKIKSSLVDFSMNAKNRIPGIKDLDAVINLNLNNKVFNLIVSDSNGLSINFPNLFSNPLYFGSMDGSLNLNFDSNQNHQMNLLPHNIFHQTDQTEEKKEEVLRG